jgi:hypothetical protein
MGGDAGFRELPEAANMAGEKRPVVNMQGINWRY